MKITFEVNGQMKFLYDDSTAAVAKEVGPLTIKRASHVEPYDDGQWYVDMSPVDGPSRIGPYPTREEALSVERDWLVANGIPIPR